MDKTIRIGTRESRLALWQAEKVRSLLTRYGYSSELVYIKSDGDKDLLTPLYEIGVEGVFTRALDTALINHHIDIAVHSMKDVPIQPAAGIVQAAVLERGSHKDILVYKPGLLANTAWLLLNEDPEAFSKLFSATNSLFTVATSSLRRKAQWLNRFPAHRVENLRGNVDSRLKKLYGSNWHGAIFAAAGLERINLMPENSIDLGWMLPAPAQGAIMVVCREADTFCLEACSHFNDAGTALCVKLERDFLKELLGGCSTPVSALAKIEGDQVFFSGSILSPDGSRKAEIEKNSAISQGTELGKIAAADLLSNGGLSIAAEIRHASK